MINHKALIKIYEFESLMDGWCYGEGKSLAQATINSAEEIFYVLFKLGIDKTDAFPGLDGEIRVTGYDNEHYFELTVEDSGLVTYLYEKDEQEEKYFEDIGLTVAIEKITDDIKKIKSCQNLLEHYIQSIGIKKEIDSRVWHSNHPVMVGGSPFFVQYALNPRVAASACISKDTIKKSAMIHQSTGNSTHQYYQIPMKSKKRQAQLAMNAIAT
jgi:hypothetical protein